MEESMHKRLEAIRIRYEELEKELTSEEVATDVAKFTRLSKEKSDIEEAYEKYSEYLRLSQEVKDSLEMEEVFPKLLINMTQAGEASGSLDVAYERMALQFEKEAKLKGLPLTER